MIFQIIKRIMGWSKAIMNGIKYDKNLYIGRHVKVSNLGNIIMGSDVIVRPLTHLYCGCKESTMIMEDGVEIGRGSTISCVNKVTIGRYVLTAPYVYIADHNHEYNDITTPVCKQGVRINDGDEVMIGEGTWIGINAVIVGNVHIGKNCVIGANSVVVNDIPDYCVAVGVPAKVVKRYSHDSGIWIKVRSIIS